MSFLLLNRKQEDKKVSLTLKKNFHSVFYNFILNNLFLSSSFSSKSYNPPPPPPPPLPTHNVSDYRSCEDCFCSHSFFLFLFFSSVFLSAVQALQTDAVLRDLRGSRKVFKELYSSRSAFGFLHQTHRWAEQDKAESPTTRKRLLTLVSVIQF